MFGSWPYTAPLSADGQKNKQKFDSKRNERDSNFFGKTDQDAI